MIYAFILLISMGGVFLLTPFVIRIAPYLGAIDKPVGFLQIHTRPIPRLGGSAMFIGFVCSFLLGWWKFGFMLQHFQLQMVGILSGALIMFIVGAIDDIYGLLPWHKLLSEIIVVAIVLFCNLRGSISSSFLTISLIVLYIMGACNSLNLLDGVDGLAAGITAIASGVFLVLFILQGEYFGIILSIALLGSCVGFLWYNFNPASIFMGDSGSHFLGYMLAVLAILYSQTVNNNVLLIVPILILAVPVGDTFLTIVRRLINKKPLLPGDRDHFYDKLLQRGFSQRQTVSIIYGLGIIFGITAIVTAKVGIVIGFILGGFEILGVTFMAVRMQLYKC